MNGNTYEIWRGPSTIDGAPIVLLASGFGQRSGNGKTGDMLQTWILRADMPPTDAVKAGADASICGDCALRGDGTGKDRPCYVTVFRAPLAIWRSWDRGNVATMSPSDAAAIIRRDGRSFRLGSYGDPAAVPFEVWQPLADAAPTRTGYTHQWRTADRSFRSILMASVDTLADAKRARRAGWRTFRTRSADMPLSPDEFVCPASEEAGRRSTCERCHLCDGRRRADTRRHPVIIAHGPTATRWGSAVGMEV